MRTTFHVVLRTTGNTKLIVNDIGYAEELERLERATEVNVVVFERHLQHEADAKTKDANVGLGHVHGGGGSCKRQTGFEAFCGGLGEMGCSLRRLGWCLSDSRGVLSGGERRD